MTTDAVRDRHAIPMPMKVLVVDDEQLAREELSFLLAQVAGVEVVGQAANGIEAMGLIEENYRLPMVPPSPAARNKVIQVLQNLKMLGAAARV